MRLLIVTPNYEPAWVFGGVVRAMSNLCVDLSRQGRDVTVLSTNVDGAGGTHAAPVGVPTIVSGVRVVYFPSSFGPRSDFASWRLSRYLKSCVTQFDLLYLAATWQWIGFSSAMVASSHQVPYVVGVHGGLDRASLRHGLMRKRLYWFLFLKRFLRNAEAVHFCTDHEQQQARWLPKAVSALVVPNGVWREGMQYCVGKEEALEELLRLVERGPESRLILSVGRCEPGKRLDLVLRAVATLVRRVPESVLLVAGKAEGRYSERMKNLAGDLGIGGRVIWLGHLSESALRLCYRASEVFVLPSAHENFSLATVESLAAGTPVVISGNLGVASAVAQRRAGFVVASEVEAIAGALGMLLGSRELRSKMGAEGVELVRDCYDRDKCAAELWNGLSRRVAERKRRPS